MKIIGLVLSNGLVGLAGGLLAQYQGSANINMGRGAIVIGLASVIIGEVIFGARFNFAYQLGSIVAGSVIYQIVIAFVLQLGLSTEDLKLFSAVTVALALSVPALAEKIPEIQIYACAGGEGVSGMLELKNIHKVFNPGTINEKRAIQNLSFTLNDGDFVTVIGGNGAGKSTMLNLIAGVYTADAGSIVLDGADITKLPEYKRAKLLGRVFQDPMMGTAGNMGIEENLAMAYRRGRTRTLRWGISNEEREFYKEKLQMLDLGLEGRLASKVRLLSGGQRQALTLLMATLRTPGCCCWTSTPPRWIQKPRTRCLRSRKRSFPRE